MTQLKAVLLVVIFILIGFGLNNLGRREPIKTVGSALNDTANLQEDEDVLDEDLHSLSIENLRRGNYPGSEIITEQTLDPGSNYQRYLTSYQSEGLKIYALLTIPNGPKPSRGWPAIIFNHGYIPPTQYKTTERYVAYVDGFARKGYVVFRPDYRGHGKSEGTTPGAYGSNAYTTDVLNATTSIKKYKDVDGENIGMWGHSLGGYITLRSMVVTKDIKVGVIWAGVVGSYPDLLNNWRRGNISPLPLPTLPSGVRRWRQSLVEQYGEPDKNPQFWNSISANNYLDEVSGPIQLHHGSADTSVPIGFSQKLYDQMKAAGKETEFYTYPGDDHNISNNFNLAMQRSVTFFDNYLKGGERL